MANGNGFDGSALATISKSGVLKLLLQVGGVSGLIALFLVYTMARDVSSNTIATRQMVTQHVTDSKALMDTLRVIGNILLQDCVNKAGVNGVARDKCFNAQYRTPLPSDR